MTSTTNPLDVKRRFVDDGPRADKFQEFVSQPIFKEAAAGALVELIERQKSVGDLQSATLLSARILGAREYLDILLNFGHKHSPKTAQQPEGLTPV